MESEVFPQGLFVQCGTKTIFFPLVLALSNMISSNKTSCCTQKRAFMRTLLMRTALVRCNLKPELTNARIDAWAAQLKTELGSKH